MEPNTNDAPARIYLTGSQEKALSQLSSFRKPSQPITNSLFWGAIRPGLAGAIVPYLSELLKTGYSDIFRSLAVLIFLGPETLTMDQWHEFITVIRLLRSGARGTKISNDPSREPGFEWYREVYELLASVAGRLEPFPGSADGYAFFLKGVN